MSEQSAHPTFFDLETGLPLDRDELLRTGVLDRLVQAGEISTHQAAQILQAAERRYFAEHGPDLDTDEEGIVSVSGFGSGRGMGNTRTGN